MNWFWICTLATLLLLGLLELLLRWRFGLGNPLLYITDAQIGYLLAPNQRVQRFGNQIEINQYSMRSPAIAMHRPDQTLRVLLLGDSVTNGSWWTDQTNTISAILQASLSSLERFQTSGEQRSLKHVEVLNASANSWGPRNELAYLQRFGTFGAQLVVLILNTDDLFATAPVSAVVGHDRNYPDRKPLTALGELLQRYALPAPAVSPELQAVYAEGGDRVGNNLTAIDTIHQLTQTANAVFLLMLTPLRREIGQPGPRDYERSARQRLLALTQQQMLNYVDGLATLNRCKQPDTLYRDHIHLSPTGNQLISRLIAEWVQSHWQLIP